MNLNDELRKKISELEQRLILLENSSFTENNTNNLKDAARVTGHLELSKIIKVNSSEFELVDIYNEIPHFLSTDKPDFGQPDDESAKNYPFCFCICQSESGDPRF